MPNTGTFPHIPSDSLISRYCQIGPTVRFIEDLYPFMNILYGPDGVDKQVRDKSEIRLSSPCDFHPQKNVVVFDNKSIMNAEKISLDIVTKDISINSENKVKILSN